MTTPEARLAAAMQGTHGQLNGSYVDVARRILAADPTLAADLDKAREYDAMMDDVRDEARRTGMTVAIPVHISEALALAAAAKAFVSAQRAWHAEGHSSLTHEGYLLMDAVDAAKEASE